MADNKKSFMFYCDWQETFKMLPDEKAGELIKHILSYVNDENPISDDLLIKAVFANIKQTLKRDLKKWEQKSIQNSLNAKKRWDANECERIKPNAKNADRDIVIDTVKDNVIVKDKVNDILLIKKDKSFSSEVFNCFDNCLNFFSENLHPKNETQKNNWLESIEKLNRIENIPFEVIEEITKKTREDDFWSKNFLSLCKLRKKNNDGIMYIQVFYERFNTHKQTKHEKQMENLKANSEGWGL